MRKLVKREFTASVEDGRIKKLNGYEITDDGTCILEFEVEIEVADEPIPEVVKEVSKPINEQPTTKVDTTKQIANSANQNFIVVDVENLALDDEFMKFQVQTSYEQAFKGNLINVIKQKRKNFCKPIYDPTINGGQGLAFISDMEPAVGMNFMQWFEIAKTYNPGKNSRIGSREDYIAFLGYLIKTMVKTGIPLETAWNYVCNNSSDIGVYATGLSFQNVLRKTGSKEICGFYDLANTQKVLLSDLSFAANFYWKAGGSYQDDGRTKPLATFEFCTEPQKPLTEAVAWIIWDA